MLNYLEGSTRPDLSMAVHQTARFNQNPMFSHEKAVKSVRQYLMNTKEKDIICKVNRSKGIECYVDADFAGGGVTC